LLDFGGVVNARINFRMIDRGLKTLKRNCHVSSGVGGGIRLCIIGSIVWLARPVLVFIGIVFRIRFVLPSRVSVCVLSFLCSNCGAVLEEIKINEPFLMRIDQQEGGLHRSI
jgi:hypothetical protein